MNTCVDGCNLTTTPFVIGSNITTEIEWPETSLGDTTSVPCPCAEFAGSLAGRAYRYCSGTFSLGANWEMYDTSDCEALNSMTTRRLCVAALLLAQVYILSSRILTQVSSSSGSKIMTNPTGSRGSKQSGSRRNVNTRGLNARSSFCQHRHSSKSNKRSFKQY